MSVRGDPDDPPGPGGGPAPPAISLGRTDCWIFDLDGVLTDTASLHRQAWRQLFDGLFADWARVGAAPGRSVTTTT